MIQTITNGRIVTPTEDFIGTLIIKDSIIKEVIKTEEIYENAINLNRRKIKN